MDAAFEDANDDQGENENGERSPSGVFARLVTLFIRILGGLAGPP